MSDRTDEIRAKHASSRPCGCCRDIFYLLDVNARLRKVADAAREWRRVEILVATSLDYRGDNKAITTGYRLMADAKSALLAALDALGDGQ